MITIRVEVQNGNVEKALGILKKLLQKDGVMEIVRRKQHYEKPSVRRRKKSAEARRRAEKKNKKIRE